MKFCYIDESGTGGEPISVMVGIVTDHNRMRPTKSDWKALLAKVSSIVGRSVSEIHTHELYAGNSPFRNMTFVQRLDLISEIFKWLEERKHSIVYTGVDTVSFRANCSNEAFYADIGGMWRHMAFHITLSVQKYFQGFSNNKGNCVLIFDNKVTDQTKFTRLILDPPSWSDSYYSKKKREEQLSQIVDVPHFVDSKHVELIQLADFLCYFIRKHLEFSLNLRQPKYEGEHGVFKQYNDMAVGLSIPKANIFLSRGRCSASEYFWKYAPSILR